MQIPIAHTYAETLGLNALAFVVASPDALSRFMGLSGIDATTLRERATQPEVLAAVLDFLLTNEELLTAFCREQAIEPRQVHLAAARLGS